jgi:hypothetical protein
MMRALSTLIVAHPEPLICPIPREVRFSAKSKAYISNSSSITQVGSGDMPKLGFENAGQGSDKVIKRLHLCHAHYMPKQER